MLLSAFKQTLSELDKLKFQLPNGQLVPSYFHITEVGKVTRNYIDCGGVLRQENKLNLQLSALDKLKFIKISFSFL